MGTWNVNSYALTYDDKTILIDVGGNKDEIEKAFSDKDCSHILLTHGHFDHVGDIHSYIEDNNITLCAHSADKKLISRANLYRKIMGDGVFFPTPIVSKNLDKLSSISISDKIIQVIHTPGHTKGSVCFNIDNNLFVGDLILKNGYGRTDMPGGDVQDLMDSIKRITSEFQGCMIYPGHGEPFLLDNRIKHSLLLNEY